MTTTLRAPTAPTVASKRSTWMSIATLVLGIGAAAVSLLGPLVTGTIRYHVSDSSLNQVAGGDFAGLMLVAPASVLAAFLLWRGHRAGPVLAFGPALYGLYMYSQLAVSGDIAQYPGNSERFFLLYLGLFVLAGAIAVRAWSLIEHDLPAPSRRLDQAFAWFLAVVATFLTIGLHLPGMLDAWSSTPTSSEYLADPVVFWLVKFMDLGVVVPVLGVTAIGLLGGLPWAAKARFVTAGWPALLGSSVAGMAMVMQVNGDPASSTANTVVFGAFALIALGFASKIYRPLFEQTEE